MIRPNGYNARVTTATQTELLKPKRTPVRAPREFRWTYKQYMQLVKLGVFANRRVELLGGKFYLMAPQLDRHAASISLCQRALEKVFSHQFWVRPQLPLHIDAVSGLEPDISVVAGDPRNFVGTGHPKSALLIVEISETSLRYDRGKKAPRYAMAGIQDYWIVNLIDRCVEIYRKPVADPSARRGWRYLDVSVLTPPASIAPLAAPQGPIAIADLLP
jgi:Uma2 family endonuclease